MHTLRNKNILLISPESWGKSMLSKHLYAIELTKRNNKVFFLNSPSWRRDESAREAEKKNPGLFIIDDDAHFRGLRFLPRFIQKWVLRSMVKKLEQKTGVHFDVVWSFDNSRYFLLDVFKNATRIHQVMDEHMKYNLTAACKSAHACFGVTPGIVEECTRHNVHSYFIHHGYFPVKQTEAKLMSNPCSINVVYVGNLFLPSFDIDFVKKLAMRFEDICFHLVGSISAGNLNATTDTERDYRIDKLAIMRNVYLYGERTYDDAFTIASQADVLLLLYFGGIAKNSSKILPYLSTGKVIVSGYYEIYDGMDLLEMAVRKEDYVNVLESVINNINNYNDASHALKRKDFAAHHTYTHHIDEMEKKLESTIG